MECKIMNTMECTVTNKSLSLTDLSWEHDRLHKYEKCRKLQDQHTQNTTKKEEKAEHEQNFISLSILRGSLNNMRASVNNQNEFCFWQLGWLSQCNLYTLCHHCDIKWILKIIFHPVQTFFVWMHLFPPRSQIHHLQFNL